MRLRRWVFAGSSRQLCSTTVLTTTVTTVAPSAPTATAQNLLHHHAARGSRCLLTARTAGRRTTGCDCLRTSSTTPQCVCGLVDQFQREAWKPARGSELRLIVHCGSTRGRNRDPSDAQRRVLRPPSREDLGSAAQRVLRTQGPNLRVGLAIQRVGRPRRCVHLRRRCRSLGGTLTSRRWRPRRHRPCPFADHRGMRYPPPAKQ